MDEKDKEIEQLQFTVQQLEGALGEKDSIIESLDDQLSTAQRKIRNLEVDYEERIRSMEYDTDRMKDDYDRQVRSLEDRLSDAEYQIRNLEGEVQNARYRNDW